MSGPETRDPTRCKVGRLIAEYDLEDMGEELERRWTGTGDERASLRVLADEFNRRLLAVALDEVGRNPVAQDVTATYEVLTGDDVSEGVRTQKRLELSRDGVDVEALLEDFVSHQAVHTYLREYRGARREDDADQIERDVETLRRLQARVASVTADAVERSATTGRIDVGAHDVLVNVRVFCQDCGADYDAVELLTRGGCDCEP
ncbi:rod-determining factor RdfA [Halobacterium wangiae]|uniref:rod-determining factor RdfA n=1 Tax=Halobacterium wangiae TaxID=2902623 RepID=UPI001E3A3655|nr:rod-determining factor RdfA [Halobacterium wangiae]